MVIGWMYSHFATTVTTVWKLLWLVPDGCPKLLLIGWNQLLGTQRTRLRQPLQVQLLPKWAVAVLIACVKHSGFSDTQAKDAFVWKLYLGFGHFRSANNITQARNHRELLLIFLEQYILIHCKLNYCSNIPPSTRSQCCIIYTSIW